MKLKQNLLLLLGASLAFFSCADWTEPMAEQMTKYSNTEVAKTETYYQALRDWKKTKHSISFGWWAGWSPAKASTTNMLSGLPDSMDVVSLWDNSTNLSESQKRDLNFVQKKKGTKVLFCSFTQYVGQHATPKEHNETEDSRHAFWGWDKNSDELKEAAVRKYANAIIDTINKYNYDGFDIDFEPNYGYPGELSSNNHLMHIFITELGKHIGPMSPNPEKLLVVDGEPQTLNAETAPYISYFIIQAYFAKEANLDSRLALGLEKFKNVLSQEEITNRYIMTENLESAIDCLNGGYSFSTRDGQSTPYKSLEGFARWQPTNGFRKGGFGAYHFDGEAVNTPAYKYMRRAIQAQNPSVLGK